MQAEVFVHQIAAIGEHLTWLHQNVNQLPLSPQNWLEDVFKEVSTALEELHVVQEELLRQNAELCRREQELSDFVNNAAIGLHWVGADGYIRWANQAELELLGYSLEEYIGHHISEFHADQEVIDDILRRLKANETLHDYEARLLCKDGSIKYVLIDSNVFWKDEQFIHTRCFTRDITEHKRTQTALRESQQQLQTILDNSPAVIYVIDDQNRHLLVNRRYENLVSMSTDQCLGKSLYDIWPDEIADGFAANNQRVLESGIPIEVEEVAPDDDGMHTYISIKFPLHDASGVPYAVCGISTDITDRKHAEQKLRENEERFRSLSACSPVGIFLTDIDGRCTYANLRCQVICGFTLKEGLGEGWSRSIHPEDRQRVFADWFQTTRKGRSYSDEFRLQTKEGSVRWVHVRSSPMFSDKGELIGHVGTVEDITERKQALERLRESENHLRTIIETQPECVKLVASDGTLLDMNAAGLTMVEVKSAEAVIGQSVYSLIAPEHQEAFVALNEQVCQGNKGTLEFEIIGLQGTRRWLETHAVPLRSESDGTLVQLAVTRDITVRKQAEEELRQLNTALENAVEGISRLDSQGRYIAVNKAYASTLGYQPEEMIGMSWQLTVHPNDLPKLVDGYQQMLKAGKTEVEARGLRKDGSIFYKQAVMVAAYDSQGQFIGHHCFVKDITERKQALDAIKQAKEELEIRVEERTAELRVANEQLLMEIAERKRAEVELERSLSLLRGTLEATADGIIVTQNGKHIATCNQKFVEMWSIPESVITSREIEQLVPLMLEQLKDSEAFLGQTQDLLSQADAEAYGIYELKDGRVFERYSQPQWMGGKIVGRVCSFRDITQRQQAEAALRESEARLCMVVTNAPVILYALDSKGVISFSDGKESEVWGVKPGELVGQSIFDLCADKPEIIENIRHVLAGEEGAWSSEEKGCVYDNRATPLRDKNGQVVGLIGIACDITERKQAELELQQSEQKYRNLFHNSLVGIFRTTLADGTVLDANAAILKMFGYDSYEGVKAPDVYVNPADRETLKQQLFERGFVENFETQVRRTDGSVFWVSYSGKLYAKESYLEGVMIDITQRKLAEEALQKAHDQLEIRVEERTAQLSQAIARFQELACREALLNRLAAQIRNSLALDTILETAVQEIYNRLEIDVCAFAWYAKDSTTPGWNVVKEAKNPDLPSFLGLYPLESWRPFSCELFSQEQFLVNRVTETDDAVQQMLLPFGTADLLSLPIETQSGKLGTLTCGRLDYRQSWTDEELELLQAVTNQLAIGINQAQLYEQSRIAATTAQTKATQLEVTLRELQQTQAQLIQSEKMSSLGQLVAGVAHEINNPVNFIYGNLTHIHQYTQDLLKLIQLYQKYHPHSALEIQALAEAIDLDFIQEDLPKILSSMEIGTDRIRQIVLSLRNFSRLDEAEKKWVDIHEGLDNTLMILAHRLKARQPEYPDIQVIKNYGNLPKVQCYAGQLNQVFMNILSNAIDAIEDNQGDSLEDIQKYPRIIQIRTNINDNNQVIILISDNGPGMTQEVQRRIFDPFFTTKPVGQGTGLGMSISYKIVVERHSGQLECISAPGQGTEFLISIPIQ